MRELVAGEMAAGEHSVEWDGRDGSGARVASGIYLYRLQAGDFAETRKLILAR